MTGVIKHILVSFIILLLLAGTVYTQTRSNLELIHSLIDSSALSINSRISASQKEYYVTFTSGNDYKYLKNRLIAKLSSGIKISLDSVGHNNAIRYNLDYAGMIYSDSFKDGIFGGFKLKRTAIVKGNYQIVDNNDVIKSELFEYAEADSIYYDDLEFVEQAGLPFTQAELPPEPFLPTLIEPIIAIGTVVITVILFFTVRSK